MELESCKRVFKTRWLRPPSPDGMEVDWNFVATAQVKSMLLKARIVGRRNPKSDIEKITPFFHSIESRGHMEKVLPVEQETKKEKVVSNILADMASFDKYA